MGRRLLVQADGGSRGNPGPSGFGAVVKDQDTGEVLAEVAEGIGVTTNNVAEYRGLIAGLRACAGLEPSHVLVQMDSKLAVMQASGSWKVKTPHIAPLLAEAKEAERALGVKVTYSHIPRALNAHADRLANQAMDATRDGRPIADTLTPRLAETAQQPELPLQSTAPANRLSGWVDGPGVPTTTLLLRHGQTAMSIEKRFSGSSDPELTEVGVQQAQELADRIRALADGGELVAAVRTSPLRRARRTAELVARRLRLDVVVDADLRETDFGAWEGFTFSEVKERWPAELAAWLASPEVAPPGGESFAATERRVRAALDRAMSTQAGAVIALVTHVSPIKTLVRLALEAPPSALYRLHLDLASISRVDWHPDGVAVVRTVNETAHLS